MQQATIAKRRKLIIFGASDLAEIAYVYFDKDSDYEITAFTVHEAYIKDRSFLGTDVVPFESVERIYPPENYSMFVAIGFRKVNRARAEVYEACKAKGYRLATYVSSQATTWDNKIGDNCFILENNVVQPFVEIGNDVVIWSGNHIGHHSTIGDHCFIASHAVISGNCHIEPYSFIGVNATLRDGIRVGEASIIGAGALILRNTKDEEVYAAPRSEPARAKSSELISF